MWGELEHTYFEDVSTVLAITQQGTPSWSHNNLEMNEISEFNNQ